MRPLADFRFGIGPLTKNITDACIEFANEHRSLLLIPSRRQVEYSGGYANNWTTEEFVRYVRERTDNILLMRDHAGPGQGDKSDSGLLSLKHDCQHLDLIHIDPWKVAADFDGGCELTRKLIDYCFDLNPLVQYEIGTEEAIFRYEEEQLEALISYLRRGLFAAPFRQIRFAVIQCGTALKGNTNTGNFNRDRLEDMLSICEGNDLLSKEHNGDYLPPGLIANKFALGLNSINIAPEFGQIEAATYLAEMDEKILDTYAKICYVSQKWTKWISLEEAADRRKLVNACGHYVVSSPEFVANVRPHLRPDIDLTVKRNISDRLKQLHGIAS